MKYQAKHKKQLASNWFKFLQEQICNQFQILEKELSKSKGRKLKKFIKKEWKKSSDDEGGGTSYILSNGEIFDKVGVNQSTVSGKFPKIFRSKIPGANKDGKFWASGISIVAHMKNPKMPALHFNTRYIVTSEEWFGGGIDMTPSFVDKREENIFHSQLRKVCVKNGKNYYKYKKWCDNYFYLKHRKEPRGIGGLFFDYKMDNWEKDFLFVKHAGYVFNEIIHGAISKKMFLKWSKKQKEIQAYKRGRYVEFNLLYDRGTKFGLNSGGNPNAILVSLPPSPKWK